MTEQKDICPTPIKDVERFASKFVVHPNGCWDWVGPRSERQYGKFYHQREGKQIVTYAHRYSYQLVFGPMPKGLVTDHLCRVHSCVNPAHLEAVTQDENMARSIGNNSIKTHCAQGHEYSPENTRIYLRRGQRRRLCIACHKAWQKKYYQEKKHAAVR